MSFARYFAAYERLISLSNIEKVHAHSSPKTLKISLQRTRQLLKRLGNPQAALKFVHVTGTSGKGSVTSLMHHILKTDGRKVGSYLSPHTTTYIERFLIDDKLPHPDALAHALEDVIAAHQEHIRQGYEPLSFFELNICTAFLLFVREGVEWCALEVGMGGRWDATNVIPAPAVAMITNIDLDHVEFLGHTKTLIAKEKSGIIKPGCVAITGETDKAPLTVIRQEAKKQKVPLVVIPNEQKHHRAHNADLCRAASRIIGIHEATIEKAIRTYRALPCRLEVIQKNGPRVIIDGAHNAAKMRSTAARVPELSQGKIHLIFGCKGSKDGKSMAKDLSKIISSVRTTRFIHGHGHPGNPQTALRLFPTKLRREAYLFSEDALAAALKEAKKSDTILITGSLYLAGEMRAHWRSEQTILRERQS